MNIKDAMLTDTATPGTWHVSTTKAGDTYVVRVHTLPVRTLSHFEAEIDLFVVTEASGLTFEKALANARLIAAAPELLAALQASLARMEAGLNISGRIGYEAQQNMEAIKAARAAILRATTGSK